MSVARSVARIFEQIALDIGILAVLSLLTFGGAFTSFVRYDVR